MTYSRTFLFALITACTLPFIAGAQSESYRIDRLERDIQFLQKHIYANKNTTEGNNSSGSSYQGADAAQIGVQLSEIVETIRQLRGDIEQIQHQQNLLADKLDRFEKDADYRFNALESRIPAPMPPVIGGTAESLDNSASAAVAATTESIPQPTAPEPSSSTTEAATPSNTGRSREEYNNAFRLLNQGNYDQSAAAFEAFIDRYDNDPLLGNAYYWLGETHYVRSRHPQAADAFRQGFEAMPDGPKAPDNLYKMALSLSNMSKKKEACVVLSQLVKKYGDRDTSVILRAQQEYDRINCN